MLARARLIWAVAAATAVLPLWAEPPADTVTAGQSETAQALVRDMVWNETHDSERDSQWAYRMERITPEKSLVREQVETRRGPVFRIIEENGAPLDAAEQQREEERLNEYIHDASAVDHAEHSHEEDEQRVMNALQLLPRATLFEFVGVPNGNVTQLRFRPNPAYVSDSYEGRVLHVLSGTMTIDLKQRRLIDIRGTLSERVDFGFGLLGHVEKGGTFEIHRRQVSPEHWKTDVLAVHINGKILMMKTITRDQKEVRQDFRPVPANTTLEEAKAMLEQPDAGSTEAEIGPVSDGARQR